ncbi:hypothetical protein AAFF_G00238190 [Aldrovandia affinis]|uniref:RUN domain-containing protein n=1 Tax=Aldrovandia affinis TaxID=143900 RepID=A0AAD7W4I5_9TELE|nr:hypothetical protein AAFF_G00238190 [Aldrovandia affinis]
MLSPTRPSVPPRPRRATSHKQDAVEQKTPELGSWREDINMNTTTNTAVSPHHGYASNGPAESVRSRELVRAEPLWISKETAPFQYKSTNPMDNNSTYNLNYINNNTVTFGQQLQQTQSSSDESHQEVAHKTQQNPNLTQLPAGKEDDKTEESEDTENRTEVFRDEYADEDDTLIPSCWDCPPSLLEFSLSSFASSSSTSISGCSDLESDCPDAISLSCQDFPPELSHSDYPLAAQPHIALMESYPSPQSPLPPCSPNERFPSAPSTTSSDSSEGNGLLGQDDGGLDLQKLSDSVDELSKAIHRQAVQLARWDMEDYLGLSDELDHLEGRGQMSKQWNTSCSGGIEEPIPYFTFYSSTPSLSSAPHPIPPPRRKRQARLEALRKASNQDEGTPLPPPPPTSRALPLPPPLPPATALPTPAVSRCPPTSLPPLPPSFHALDDEIRKLLILAGVTQAELLKLGPELGVGVMELLEPGDGEGSEAAKPGEPEGMEIRGGSRGARGRRQDADTDTLSRPCAVSKVVENGTQQFAAGAKVTTFKELRSQSRQNPLPAVFHKEPDPTVLTPDPDFLYSLKWTTAIDADSRQWETSTQAQTSVIQPPPITPLAPLKVMLLTGHGELLPRPYPLIGCSACERRLQAAVGSEREEDEATVRGRADGGIVQESRATVCSLSPAEPVQRGGALRFDVVRAHLGGQGPSSPCQQEKRALLSPISVAVDAILAQFTSARTLVQKVQSGDSRVNPSLGRLVVQCLCPALNGLLSDGLKPYQTDLIAGRRPNSPWGLVQASTGPGPSTQALHSLQCQVSQLPQLKQSRHRFNAFLLGLLNIKLLDHWIFHLQSCDDVLETHYRPTSFMWLSRTSCQPLFEELLLLLQPLSLLTLNLDLLFQHHNFDPTSPTPSPVNYNRETPGLANQACSFRIKGLSCWRSGQSGTIENSSGVLKDNQKAKLTTLANNRNNGLNWPANGRPRQEAVAANKVEAPNQILWKEQEIPPPSVGTLPQPTGQAMQQGWGSVVQWGGNFGQSCSNKPGQVMSAGSKARSLPQDSWSRTAHIESDYITHKAQRYPVPECNSVAPWVLGMLFGAPRGQRKPQTCTLSTRPPSHWLAPGASVLSRIVSPNQRSESEERGVESEWGRERGSTGTREHPRPLRSVRTQREHRAQGQLY